MRRDLHVVDVVGVTPRYRRIVLSGDDLADFPYARFAPSDHLRVFFPDPVTDVIVAYRITGDDWELDGEGEPVHRDYTVRAWEPDRKRLTFDIALHEHGVASTWARRAWVGDRLVANGPSANQRLPEDYAHYLAIGDETALPAIARIVEEAPRGAHVTAVVEVANADEEQPLSGEAEATVRWVHRGVAPAGDGRALETAVRSLALPPLSSLFVFAAGETGVMRTIRRHVRSELGLPRHQVVVDGYWRRGVASFDHHDADIPDD